MNSPANSKCNDVIVYSLYLKIKLTKISVSKKMEALFVLEFSRNLHLHQYIKVTGD